MQKIYILLGVFLSLQIAWNCNNNTEQTQRTAFHPDLDNCKLSINLKLSDLIENYRIVQLETTSESLLGELNCVINISGDYILIQDGNGIQKFSKEGKFINTIIKSGKGPDEISGSCNFFFNKNNNILYFQDNIVENEKIRCFDIKSEKFLPSIKKCFPGSWLNFIIYQDSLILGSINIISRSNPYAIFAQNLKGEFVWGIKSNKTFNVSNEDLLQRFVIYPGDKTIFLKYWSDDTLFSLNDKNLSTHLIPEYKNKVLKPNITIFEGDRIINYDPYQNPSFMIIRNGLFTGWIMEGNWNRAHYNLDFYILNKYNGEYALIQSYNDDFINRIYNLGKSVRWTPGIDEMPPLPKTSPDGLIYSIYYPNELSGIDSEMKNSPFKNLMARLVEIKKDQKETDNPILLIGYPKKRLRILN